MIKKFGIVRVSSPRQKAHLSDQGKDMVARGVEEGNLLTIVSSARPKKNSSVTSANATELFTGQGLTTSQRVISAHMESIPPNSQLIVTTASRLSRDYFFAVNVINKFYKKGCTIVIIRWKHNKDKKNPTPLNLADLQTLYSDILQAQKAGDNIERGSRIGIEAALARGSRWGGSCKKLGEKVLLRLKQDLERAVFKRGQTFLHLQNKYGISRPTLYRYRQLFKLTKD